MQPWDKQDSETDKAYAAFQLYLKRRSCQEVAAELSKSRQLIVRWANQYDWKNRAAAFDSSVTEEMRRSHIERYKAFLNKQFVANEQLQARLIKVFAEKDINKISWRTLNEIYRANFAEMVAIAEKLGVTSGADDNEIIIRIEDAERQES